MYDDASPYAYMHYYNSFPPRSPPQTPTRPEPVVNYDVRFIEGERMGNKCM